MFHKGDIDQAKNDWLAPHVTQESTKGIVVHYNPDNHYFYVGLLNLQDYAFPPILNARGCYYEVVKEM